MALRVFEQVAVDEDIGLGGVVAGDDLDAGSGGVGRRGRAIRV